MNIMGKQKIVTTPHEKDVKYSQQHWTLLAEKRTRAQKVLSALRKLNTDPLVYGSIARGDITPTSDIDILIPDVIPSYQIELLLTEIGEQILTRKIIMATPNHAIKGHIELRQETTITFPLTPFEQRELEFYQFGGAINLKELQEQKRVKGINKRLLLIIPTPEGHKELSILHISEAELVKHGFPQRIIQERLRVLTQRDQKGRTGIFLEKPVEADKTFESTLQSLIDRNPIVRKRARKATS